MCIVPQVEVGEKKQAPKLRCLNRFFNMNRAFSRKKGK